MNMNERETILACIDGSDFTPAVVDYAAWVSRTVHGPLKLLHNILHRSTPASDLSGNIGVDAREELLEELTELESRRNRILIDQGKDMLQAATDRARKAGTESPETSQRHGSLTDTLMDMEEEIRVLVLGIRGEDHSSRVDAIGTQLDTVLRTMQRPVLVVNCDFTSAPTRIMIAYDGSSAADKALEMVATSPLYRGMQCHLVNVSKTQGDGVVLLRGAGEKLEEAGLDVIKVALEGEVEDSLIAYQKEQDIHMIIMGAFGHSRLRELVFGSRTINMLLKSSVPLLLLR